MIILKCENPYINDKGGRYACGQCPSCRRNQNREWAIRARHENLYQDKAIFITISYNPHYMPKSGYTQPMCSHDACGTLKKSDLQKFWKRLRKKYKEQKIRYIACGEYGPKTWRPHYHAIVWGIGISEIENIKSKKKNTIAKIWGKGQVLVDQKPITDYAIQYVLGYIRKKAVEQNNKTNKAIYDDNGRIPPYRTQSQGIGRQYAEDNAVELSHTCMVSYNGASYNIPRYYIKRIYRLEGRVEKWRINYEDLTGRWDYKLIINPNGRLTQTMLQTQAEIRVKNMKKMREELKKIINEKTIENEIKKTNNAWYEAIVNRCNQWDIVRPSWERVKFINRDKKLAKEIKNQEQPKQPPWLLMEIKREEWEILHNSARQRNMEIRKGIFGKREKYENMEEIEEILEKN